MPPSFPLIKCPGLEGLIQRAWWSTWTLDFPIEEKDLPPSFEVKSGTP